MEGEDFSETPLLSVVEVIVIEDMLIDDLAV